MGRRSISQSERPARNRVVPVVRRNGSGAVLSQFIIAGGSLVVQVLAARTLGADGYGTFTLFSAILVVITAIQTGWVGDSLTVLDRFDPGVRGAIVGSQVFFVVMGLVVATSSAVLLHLTDFRLALIFGVMVAFWVTEEWGRRLFMARLEFWKLVLNDCIYVTVTLGLLAVHLHVSGTLTLGVFLTCMTLGAAAAIVATFFQLPREEFLAAPVTRGGLKIVSAFAVWRAIQTGTRPLALLMMRIMIVAFASRAALGGIEAARLVIAPAITFVSGAGSFLLPLYSQDVRSGVDRPTLTVARARIILCAATGAFGVLAIAFATPLTRVVTAGTFELDRVAVAGWALFATAGAAGLPSAHSMVARRQSRQVFTVRLLESAVGLVFVLVMLVLNASSLTPFGLSIGLLVGAVMLARLAARP